MAEEQKAESEPQPVVGNLPPVKRPAKARRPVQRKPQQSASQPPQDVDRLAPVDLRPALREVLGELLPQLRQDILAEVQSQLPRAPDLPTIVSQVVSTLNPQIAEQLTAAVGKLQAQIDHGLSSSRQESLQGSPQPVTQPVTQPEIAKTRLDKAADGVQRIMTIIDTALDSALPKAINILGQWQYQQMFKLANPQNAAAFAQANPVLARMIGQQLVGPNPYEQVVPQAVLSGVMKGLQIRQAATWPTSSPPAPSVSSSGAPSSPSPLTFEPTKPVSSVYMTNPATDGRKPHPTLADLLA